MGATTTKPRGARNVDNSLFRTYCVSDLLPWNIQYTCELPLTASARRNYAWIADGVIMWKCHGADDTQLLCG
jgi:hypothetical protein